MFFGMIIAYFPDGLSKKQTRGGSAPLVWNSLKARAAMKLPRTGPSISGIRPQMIVNVCRLSDRRNRCKILASPSSYSGKGFPGKEPRSLV